MTRLPLRQTAVAAALTLSLGAAPAFPQAMCGSDTAVLPGEELADVADRCGVRIGEIFDANPNLRSTRVAAGTWIDVPSAPGEAIVDRTRSATSEAARGVEGAASSLGQSVSDYLSDNPDLNRDLLEFGQRLGLPGVETSPERGAGLAVAADMARPGDTVQVSAWGLQGNTEAEIGIGLPEADHEVIERLRTTEAGTLTVAIRVPDWAGDQQSLIFVAETERVRLRSEPVRVSSR